MKKLLTLTLAAALLLTSLTSCRVQVRDPFQDAIEENPDLGDLPQSDVMKPDPEDEKQPENDGGSGEQEPTTPPPTENGEGKTVELAVPDGKFVFKESRIYDYKETNLVIAEMTNQSESNYNLTVTATYYDASGAEVFSESREYRYLAAGYSQNIVFLPMVAFDSFTYTIEAQPYSGVCFGEKHSLEFNDVYEDISNIGSKMYPTLWLSLIENNANTAKFFRVATLILFDNTGEVYGIYSDCIRHVDIKLQDVYVGTIGGIAGKLYVHTGDGPMVWPENLTGDVSGVIVPYYATWSSDLHYMADYTRIDPSQSDPPSKEWPGSYRQEGDKIYPEN